MIIFHHITVGNYSKAISIKAQSLYLTRLLLSC